MKDLSSFSLTWPDKENWSLIICFLEKCFNKILYKDPNLHALFQDHPQKKGQKYGRRNKKKKKRLEEALGK